MKLRIDRLLAETLTGMNKVNPQVIADVRDHSLDVARATCTLDRSPSAANVFALEAKLHSKFNV